MVVVEGSVMAVETQWASREELQALTAAQDQVREQQAADRERIAKLEASSMSRISGWLRRPILRMCG